MSSDEREWVVVSGGSGALGRELVVYFLDRGRHVLSLDRREDTTPPRSDRLLTRLVDLASDQAVKAALDETIPSRDRITLLVNAVGLIWNEPVASLRGARFCSHSVESWRAVLEANLTAPFVLASQVVLRMARTGGGAIVNFSSISGRGNPGQVAYSAAKAGVEGMTRAMAAELGPIGIRVNAVAPGFVDVPSTRAALSDDQLSAIAAKTPVRRLGAIDELLTAVDFLANNSFATGVVLDINGGLRL